MTYPVRCRAVAPALRRAVRAVRGRAAGVEASDLRARRRDAAAAAQPAGHGPGVGRRLRQARASRRRCRASTSAASSWLGRDRDIRPPSRPRSFAQLRSAPPSAGHKEYLGLGENTPPAASAAEAGPGGGRPRLHPAALVLGASDLGPGAAGRRARSSQPTIRTASRSSPATASPTPGSRRAPTSATIASSISRPTAWSPRARPNAPRSRRC